MASLQELQPRRARECRLTPDRALRSVDEAEEFLRDRGLLTRTPDSALPSFFEACHEEPYKPGAGGFGSWPATKWPWYEELARRPGVYALKIHRGKHVLLTEETAALADPILRAEIARMEREGDDWALILRHLDAAGPSTAEDLRVELGLKPKELKAARERADPLGSGVSGAVGARRAGRVHRRGRPGGRGGAGARGAALVQLDLEDA